MKLGVRGRCRLAGLLWVVAGSILFWRGWPYFKRLEGGSSVLMPLAALAIGVVKGWLVFGKTSRKNIARIRAEPGLRWFWSVYPLYLYVLIPMMVALGVAIRRYLGEPYPWLVVLVYFSIGAALIASSLFYFRAGAERLSLADGEMPATDSEG